jgi:ketosteroid isomerase-like protein
MRLRDTARGVSRDENTELVRRAFGAVFRRPKPDFETMNALFSPDHVYVSPTTELEGGTWSGGVGFRDFLSSWGESMEDWVGELAGTTALDDRRVLVEGTLMTRGKGSGLELNSPRAWVVTVCDGKIARTEAYRSAESAREALN